MEWFSDNDSKMAAVVKGALASRQFVGQVNLSKLICNSVLKAQVFILIV